MAVRQGHLTPLRQVGRTMIVDDLAALAWSRTATRGRPWSSSTANAALDLLTTGSTAGVPGTVRTRLARRLRTMTARQMAHASGGLGPWGRYLGAERVQLDPIGPSRLDLAELGIVGPGGWMTFARVANLDEFELDADVRRDGNGDLGAVERSAEDGRMARALLDAYLVGDARVSAAAARELEVRARAF